MALIISSALIFLFLMATTALLNARFMPDLSWEMERVESKPLVSILIPARNEAHNLPRSLPAAAAQAYPDLEVLVLDDRSTDETVEVTKSIQVRFDGIQLVRGEPLPRGWLGKNWACWQLAEKARGDLLLFVDADVVLEPDAVERAVALLMSRRLGMLSVLPRLLAGSWFERRVMPIIAWGSLALVPEPFLRWMPTSAAVVAIGQFMLFSRPAYTASGGHRSVRDQVTEDFPLARAVKSSGHSIGFATARRHAACRMYPDGAALWNGLTRSFYGIFPGGPVVHYALWGWIASVHIFPIILLPFGFIDGSIPTTMSWEAFGAVGFSFLAWVAVLWKGGLPIYWAFAYPITVLLAFVIAVVSPFRRWSGAVSWKGRRLAANGDSVEHV